MYHELKFDEKEIMKQGDLKTLLKEMTDERKT